MHPLEHTAHPGKDRRGRAFLRLGVDHRNALGHLRGGLVMVGDDDVDAVCEQGGHLAAARYAAVDRDDELGGKLLEARDGLDAQPIALLEAARDERRDVRPEIAQRARHDGRGRDAIEVEVAEDDDVTVRIDGRLDRIDRLGKANDVARIEPIALERRVHEPECFFRVGQAARDENASNERSDRKPG